MSKQSTIALLPILSFQMVVTACLVFLAGCATQQIKSSVSPISSPFSSPIAGPTPMATWVDSVPIGYFTYTLALPSGDVTATIQCSQCCTDTEHCTATFPNGAVIPEAQTARWSPDGHYAVVCRNSFHDTPCGWYEIWSAVNGLQIEPELSARARYQWSPNDPHTLVYVDYLDYVDLTNTFVKVTMFRLLDVETGQTTRLTECPNWFDACPK
jgi:hypothetical protein